MTSSFALQWGELSKRPQAGAGGMPDLALQLRVSKNTLRSPAFQEEIVSQVRDCLKGQGDIPPDGAAAALPCPCDRHWQCLDWVLERSVAVVCRLHSSSTVCASVFEMKMSWCHEIMSHSRALICFQHI